MMFGKNGKVPCNSTSSFYLVEVADTDLKSKLSNYINFRAKHLQRLLTIFHKLHVLRLKLVQYL